MEEHIDLDAHRLATAEDAIFDLYRACAFQQNEAAYNFDRVIVNGDRRVPSLVEVSSWIHSVVHNTLIVRPPEPKWWEKVYVTVRSWVVMP